MFDSNRIIFLIITKLNAHPAKKETELSVSFFAYFQWKKEHAEKPFGFERRKNVYCVMI